RLESTESFPEKVTAFRPEMAVHGKYKEPCPRCGTKIQRIRYASNETDYCPNCQTGGRLLADRSLSLLLKKDWPETPEELEEMKRGLLGLGPPSSFSTQLRQSLNCDNFQYGCAARGEAGAVPRRQRLSK